MKRKILIAKTGRNIYFNSPEKKSDLQSAEVLAFARFLMEAGDYNLDISIANDPTTCLENSAKTDLSNSFIKNYQMYNDYFHNPYVKTNYDTEDILFLFCGVWDFNNPKVKDILKLIEYFPGKIYYVLNDLRLGLPLGEVSNLFLEKKVTVLSQATGLSWHNGLPVKTVGFELLPFAYGYGDNRTEQYKHYDIGYPLLNWNDIGDFRKESITRLMSLRNGTKKLFIGDVEQISENSFNNIEYNNFYKETVNYRELPDEIKKCRSSFIVNEQQYNKANLVPNRVFESLLIGVIPVFEKETAKAIKGYFNYISDVFNIDDFTLNHHYTNIKEIIYNKEILWDIQQLGIQLRTPGNEMRIYTLSVFEEQLKDLLS